MSAPPPRVILITGASGGLGSALARALAGPGTALALHCRTRCAAARAAAREAREHGAEAAVFAGDLARRDTADLLVREVTARWGGLHVLVHSAGAARDALVVRMREEEWDEVLEVHLGAAFRLMRAAGPVMAGQGGGCVVHVVSLAAVRGSAGQANYAAAKAALVGLTRAAAREWGPLGIRVNAVSPGFLETAMTAGAPPAVRRRAVEQSALGRLGDPDDAAAVIRTLVETRGVTGQLFLVESRWAGG